MYKTQIKIDQLFHFQMSAKNQQQETPIDIASRKRYSEILEILKNPPKLKPVNPTIGNDDPDDDGEDDEEVDNRSQRPESQRKVREVEGKSSTGKGNKKSSQAKKVRFDSFGKIS